MLGKIFRGNILKYFIFSEKRVWHCMQTVSQECMKFARNIKPFFLSKLRKNITLNEYRNESIVSEVMWPSLDSNLKPLDLQSDTLQLRYGAQPVQIL